MRSLFPFLFAAFFIGLWQAIVMLGLVPAILLPSPLNVLAALFALAASGELWTHMTTSLFRVLVGFVVISALSLPLGIGIALSPAAHRMLGPVLDVSKYLPVIAFIPLTIIWFGIGDAAKIVLLALGTIPYFTSLVVLAVERVPTELIETAQTMGLTKRQILWHVIVPNALPRIVDAMRLSMAVAWTYLTVAELIAAPTGLGHLIAQSQRYLQTDKIFAGIIVIGLLGLLLDKLFVQIREKFFAWEGTALRDQPNHS